MGKNADNSPRRDGTSTQLSTGKNNNNNGSTMVEANGDDDQSAVGCFSLFGAVLSRRRSNKDRIAADSKGGKLEERPLVGCDTMDSSCAGSGQLIGCHGQHKEGARGLPEGTDDHDGFLMDEAASRLHEAHLDRSTSTTSFNALYSERRHGFSVKECSTSSTSLQHRLTDQRTFVECALSACQLDLIRDNEPLLYTQSDLDAVVNSRQQDQGKKVLELQAKLKSERAESNGKQEQMKKELNEMKRILGEYEKTIIDLTENSQRNTMIKDETLSDLIKEKEQLRADLNTAENGILDAYKRVETLKTAVSNYGSNETKLKSCIDDFKEKLRRSEERYQTLKKHAEEKLDYANREIGKVRKAKDVDMAGLDATVKKSQAKIASLEHSLEQKIAENVELTKICDDLISRVSGKES